MSRTLYADLAWLPPAPADFREHVKALLGLDAGAAPGRDIMRLAAASLNETQQTRLGEAITKLDRRGVDMAALTPLTLGIVGTGTLDLILPPLVTAAARHGILLRCVTGSYGQFVQDALDPNSAINRAPCDAVLLALDYRSLPISTKIGDRGAAVNAALSFVDTLRNGFRKSGATVILQTFAPPPEALFGNFDRRTAVSTRSLLDSINRQMVESLDGTPDLLLDVASIAETVGLAEWYSPEQWNFAKLPFATSYTGFYADNVGRLLGALRGKARRCLILDLDNTVWGGVIGDDGMEGIKIAQGDATGEAHLEVQRTALLLRERGIVLAVSSKNTDEVARKVFREHPEMLLREGDIAVFQANWNDKATNIKAIASELSLGLSSMVFLDDNPAERALVRRMLPEVAVPELPGDPALYARTLLAAGYFEATAFSDEDRARAAFYQDNAKRVALQQKAGDLDGYLASLNMVISFAPFDATGRDRIAQLINKSNQFNLTTRRYTEGDLVTLEKDPTVFTLQVRLVDLFGDNGMISVVIVRTDGSTWDIDTWLMSCRVLGRRVEQTVLRELALNARSRGIQRLTGTFRPTGRNDLVRDHYRLLGFTLVSEEADGQTHWSLDLSRDCPAGPMRVERSYELAEAAE